MGAESEVGVRLSANVSGFVQGFNAAAGAVEKLGTAAQWVGSKFGKMTSEIVGFYKKIAVLSATALAGTAVVAGTGLKTFADFETAMRNVSTVADTTAMSLDSMALRIMKMSGEIPKSTEELATGLYEVSSAGFQAEKAFQVLDASAKLAVAGQIDMATTVRATTSILAAYSLGAQDAVRVTDVLFKAIEVGQMTGQEFAQNIGDWSSTAATLGVSFESAAAAVATMTKGGKNAAMASTSLNGMMRALIKPSEEMGEALEDLGFQSARAAIEQLGLVGTFQALWEAAGQSDEVFAKLVPDTEGYAGAIGLVNAGMEDWVAIDAEFNDAMQTQNTTQKAFEKQMQSLSAQTTIFTNEMKQMALMVGSVVAPLAKLTLTLGTGFVGAINDLPLPLRQVVASLQLLAPIMAVLGGYFVAATLKTFLFNKTMGMVLTQIDKGRFLKHIPGIKRFATALAEAGGPVTMLTKKIQSLIGAFIKANAVSKLSMVGRVAGFAVLATAVGSVVTALQDAEAAGKAAAAEFADPAEGAIQSWKHLQGQIEGARIELEKAEGSAPGLLDAFKSGFQMVTPFTENTFVNNLKIAESMRGVIANYEDYMQLLRQVGTTSNLTSDQIIDGLNEMAREGDINLDVLLEGLRQFVDLRTELTSMGIEAGRAAGADEWFLQFEEGWRQFVPADKIAQLAALEKMFADVGVSIEGMTEETAHAAEIQDRAGTVAGDLANAWEVLGDAAASASDKIDAMNTIIENAMTGKTSMRDKQASLFASLEELGLVMAEVGPQFNLTTEAGQELQASLSDAASAAEELMQAQIQQGGTANDAARTLAVYVQGLIGVAQAAGFAEGDIIQMLYTMGLTPDMISTIIQLPGIDPAIAGLLQTLGLLETVDGTLAIADVLIRTTVAYSSVSADGERHGLAGAGATPSQGSKQITDQLNSAISGIMNNIRQPKPKTGGGGGGGGGGSKPEYVIPPWLAKNIAATMAQPIINELTGAALQEFQKNQVRKWVVGFNTGMLAGGTTRLGAGIISAHGAAGTKPDEDLMEAAEAYTDLVELIGQGHADMAIGLFESLDEFTNYVDGVREQIEREKAIQDWQHANNKISNEQYMQILRDRLALTEEYSDDWMSIQDQISNLNEQMKNEQDDLSRWQFDNNERSYADYRGYLMNRLAATQAYTSEWRSLMDELKALDEDHVQDNIDRWQDEEDRMANMREVGDVSLQDYRTFLNSRLSLYEKYSDEWMNIWGELHDLEEQAKEDLTDFGDAFVDAFSGLQQSVIDPIKAATDVIAAFGDQSSVTLDQIQGFYSHQLEGIQRWANTIKALQSAGVNRTFLQQLIAAGPQSLGFAESILALGTGGVSLINESMAGIDAIAAGLGLDYARSQVGAVNNVDNSFTVDMGGMTISIANPDGSVTIAQVEQAIANALQKVADSVIGRHNPPPAPVPTPSGNLILG